MHDESVTGPGSTFALHVIEGKYVTVLRAKNFPEGSFEVYEDHDPQTLGKALVSATRFSSGLFLFILPLKSRRDAGSTLLIPTVSSPIIVFIPFYFITRYV